MGTAAVALAQSSKPRIRLVSDTSNGCQQQGAFSWEIYDAANDNALLKTGSIVINNTAMLPVCYRAVRAQLREELVKYVDENNVQEPGGAIISEEGVYRTEILFAYRPNDETTGTVQWQIATGTATNPPKMINAPVTSSEVLIGIVSEGAGTSGYATLIRQGDTKCRFDGPTTSRNFVVLSPTEPGKCHDTGANINTGWPTWKRIFALSLSTQASAGIHPVYVFPNGTRGSLQGILGSAVLDFRARGGGLCDDLTLPVTGAVVGNTVSHSLPADLSGAARSVFNAWVSATDTVTIRHCSINGSNDPPAATYTVVVVKP